MLGQAIRCSESCLVEIYARRTKCLSLIFRVKRGQFLVFHHTAEFPEGCVAMARVVNHAGIFEITMAWQSSVLSGCRFLLPHISRGSLRGEHAGYSRTVLRCLSWRSFNCIQPRKGNANSGSAHTPFRTLMRWTTRPC